MRFPEEYVFSIMDSLVTSINNFKFRIPPPPFPLPVGKRVEMRSFSAHEILKES
jgi:hypothetical protein